MTYNISTCRASTSNQQIPTFSTSKLRVQSKPDDSTYIYVKTIKNGVFGKVRTFLWCATGKFVVKKINNTDYLVNINSLSKRLNANRNDAINLTFDTLVAHCKPRKISSICDSIIAENYRDGISAERKTLLEHAVRQMVNTDFIESRNVEQASSFNGDILHLRKIDGSRPLISIISPEPFAEGALGKVYRVTCLSRNKSYVLKAAKNSPEANNDIRNEIETLNHLHKKPLQHIQKKPLAKAFFAYNDSIFNGYIGKEYQGSLQSKIPTLTRQERIDYSRKILKGIIELKKEKIGHGDIKPANILIKGEKLHISDFGGAKDQTIRKNYPASFTPAFSSVDDHIGRHTLISHTIMYAFDVFSTGITLSKMFPDDIQMTSKAEVIPHDRKQNVAIRVISVQQRVESVENELLARLIADMTLPNYKNRLTAEVALQRFSTIFPE